MVAPGTKGEMLKLSITGTPEVAVKVETSAELTFNGWNININGVNKEYCPIVITIGDTEYKMGDTKDSGNHVYTNISDFKSAVENALKKDATFEPNTDLKNAYVYDRVVKWSWAFEGSGAGSYQTDEKDTALGNLTTAPTIEFTFKTTVTQID